MFDTVIRFHYLVLVFYAVGGVYILRNGPFDKWLLYVSGVLVFFNLVSAASGYLQFGIALNYSWLLQTFGLVLIFIAIWWMHKYHDKKLNQTTYVVLIICVVLLLLQAVMGVVGTGLPLLTMIESGGWSRTYYYAAAAYKSIGLMKGVLPWLSLFLLIYHKDRFSRRTFAALLIAMVFLALMTGSRSALLGIVTVLVLMTLMSVKTTTLRLSIFVSIIVVGMAFVISNSAEFERYTNYSGRYYVPVLTSSDFWANPFGIGRGNYVEAAKKGIYEVDVGNVNFSYVNNKGLGENQLFPVAESDLLLLSIELGWLFYVVYLLFLSWVVLGLLTGGKRWSARHRTGVYLLVYLFSAGISQDFWNNPISWILYPLAIAMILSRRHENVQGNVPRIQRPTFNTG